MKFLVLALFIVAAVAVPIPEDSNDAVEVIVNGVPEGTPLELGGIVDMHLNEHTNGQLASSTNLLHPYTAVGIAEAVAAEEAAAAEAAQAEEAAEVAVIEPSPVVIVDNAETNLPEGVLVPEPVQPVPEAVVHAPIEIPNPSPVEIIPEPLPETIPEPIVMPDPQPPIVIPEPPIVVPMPESVQVPDPIVIPDPVPPTVEQPQPEQIQEPIPEPAAQVPGEIYNDGLVQVQINTPQDAGMFAALQNWFSLVVNYISNGIQSSQQIV